MLVKLTQDLKNGFGPWKEMLLANGHKLQEHGMTCIFAATEKDNDNKLTVIIDYNKWQATDRSQQVMAIEPLSDKWKSFGWDIHEIDGHDFTKIRDSFQKAKEESKPTAIIAHTIKGKGVSFMENKVLWHYRSPQNEELKDALSEIEKGKKNER